ncbi:MAG: SUF system NifU family Fe-S cluster assembly protein [Puniceicoccales bacterium]|jgi:nitrogen fixation NifU-like protein|nr:SUF system NifU family Fe-S cluster assembly protein [Puniceicoccales bacterium]
MNLQEIYQSVILDHNEHPQNFGPMIHFTHRSSGHNPICGDEVEVFVEENEERIKNLSFVGEGCAICRASSSLMTVALKNLKSPEAVRRAQQVVQWLTHSGETPSFLRGDLESLGGVKNFPARVKCATLPWHTFMKAMNVTVACPTGGLCGTPGGTGC